MILYDNRLSEIPGDCPTPTKEKVPDVMMRYVHQNIPGSNWGILPNEVLWIVQQCTPSYTGKSNRSRVSRHCRDSEVVDSLQTRLPSLPDR